MFDTSRLQGALDLGFEGQEEAAIGHLRALLPEAPDDEEKGWIVLYEARFLAQLLRVTEARARLADLSGMWKATPEHDAQVAVAYALMHEMEGNPSQTLRELDRIAKKYSDFWEQRGARDLYEEIQANRGRLLAGEGRPKEALPLLEETLAFERGKPGQFYYNLGYCYFEAKEWDRCERWLKEALRRDLHPAIASATHYYLGRLEYVKGAYARAIKEFELAVTYALQAERPPGVIYAEMAKAYGHLGMAEERSRYDDLAKSAE
ncbi:MAG: tetratricopeptide repeat protein [Candidatus Acidiferrales bacterium]